MYSGNVHAGARSRSIGFGRNPHAATLLSLRSHIFGMIRSQGGARLSWVVISMGLRQRGQSMGSCPVSGAWPWAELSLGAVRESRRASSWIWGGPSVAHWAMEESTGTRGSGSRGSRAAGRAAGSTIRF